jgi:uncharacterized protein YbaR (Trm112 family)
MNKKLLAILVCPVCKNKMLYRNRPEALICEQCRLVYPVRNGSPVLLKMDARPLDGSE